MPVPVRTYATSRLRQLRWRVLLVLLTSVPLFASGPGRPLYIPLDSLGFEPQSPQFLAAGSSMLTVDYVDSQHLLFTFGVHRLMERIANDPPDDEDRMVEAVLVELPSGKVLARTDWRLHDSGQYLWKLGHGRFMLRVHDTLTTFAPMANLASGRPFREQPFLTTDRKIGAVLLSPESDLMIVETAKRKQPGTGPIQNGDADPGGAADDPAPVALSFYRLALPGDGEQVIARLGGVAYATHFGEVAAVGAGHLAVLDEGRQEWAFDFHPYQGKVKELAPFGSTCNPIPRFVSNSEFVAFGCHGGNSPQVLGGFNMRGDEMWEQNLFGDYVALSLSSAPGSGRFALERVLGESGTDNLVPVSDAGLTGENVVVYQMESGKQLLHVDCSPVERAGQNFALSPDGMTLAVVREDAIEVFSLPPLSKKDQEEIKEARAMAPVADSQPIEFAGPAPEQPAAANPVPVAKPNAAATPEIPKESSASAIAAPPAPVVASQTVMEGDPQPEPHRKRPTLYTLPGEKGNANGSVPDSDNPDTK